MAIGKIKSLGAVLELPAKTALSIQPIHRKNWPNGLNWRCCLAGSSKTAFRILIFSMAMGANYSFELISIETKLERIYNSHYGKCLPLSVVQPKGKHC